MRKIFILLNCSVLLMFAVIANAQDNCQYDMNGDMEYSEDGELYHKGELVSGVFCIYSESGQVEAKAIFKDGLMNGVAKTYYKSGKLLGEMTYKNGEQDGIAKAYHENGELYTEAMFKNGQLQKEIFYENGKIVSGVCNGRELTPAEINEQTVSCD